MSGGRFDYKQYDIQYIADQIEQVIHEFERGDKSEWGDYPKWDFKNPKTIDEFRKAIELLNLALIYAGRIDWLLSGDDGEDTFHERLKWDIEQSSLPKLKFDIEQSSLPKSINVDVLTSMKRAYTFIQSITDASGPYTYVNRTPLVADAYKEASALREVMEQLEGKK